MILKDHHIHTHFSPDADPKATFERYIHEAKKRGFQSITFTDHHDIDAAHPLFQTHINFDTYFKIGLDVQSKADINVRLGVEVGYQTHTKEALKTFLTSYPFEYVILSIHYIEKKDLYTGEYFIGKTMHEAYQTYFDMCLEAIEAMDNFDTFGHLDYISRYAPYDDYDYDMFKETIDNILLALIKKNKYLEINTSGFVTEHRMYPKIEVVNRYIELGGTLLTVGSDSHQVSELGRFFDQIPKHILTYLI